MRLCYKTLFVVIMIIISLVLNSISFADVLYENEEFSYRIYYDKLTGSIIDEISTLDLVILEPLALEGNEIEKIKYKGDTTIYGYISVMDVENYDSYKIDQMKERDYLIIDGKKAYNNEYDCFIGDITSKHYRQILLAIIDNRIISNGFDGVFLDTVDRIEEYDERTKKNLERGYMQLLEEIKARFPNIKIFQNRGFKSFLGSDINYIDAILYENYDYQKIMSNLYYQNLVTDLTNKANENGVEVFAVSFQDNIEGKNYAKTIGWKYLYHPDGAYYNIWY